MPTQAQMELTWSEPAVTRAEFVAYLNDGARQPVKVRINRNRVSMITILFDPYGPIRLNIHEAFLSAPEEVRKALRTYLRSRRKVAWQAVSRFADKIQTQVPRRPQKLVTAGTVYDLETIGNEVNRTFFNGRARYCIGWTQPRQRKRRRRRRYRHIRYGSWMPSTQTIKVNHLLDDKRVPQEFVRYIVFHEMLHGVVPDLSTEGRRQHHGPQFKALEKAFPDFERMKHLADTLFG